MDEFDVQMGDWLEFRTCKHGQGYAQVAGILPREGAVEPTTFTLVQTNDKGQVGLFIGVSRRCVKGIKLTTELIQKLGFKPEGSIMQYAMEGVFDEIKYDIIFDLDLIEDENHLGDCVWCSIRVKQRNFTLHYYEGYVRYLHELQDKMRSFDLKTIANNFKL